MHLEAVAWGLFMLLSVFVMVLKRWVSLCGLKDNLWSRNTGQQLTSSSLRVMSLNLFLRSWGVSDDHATGDHKDERMREWCAVHLDRYDLICLQEVFGVFQFRCNYIVEQAQQHGFHYAVLPCDPPLFSRKLMDSGLVVLSRFPIHHATHVSYQHHAHCDQFASKGFQHCVIKIGEGFLNLINSHVQSDYSIEDDLATRVKLGQYAQMGAYIDAVCSPKDPLLIAGDLNANAIHWDAELHPQLHSTSSITLRMFQALGLDPSADVVRCHNPDHIRLPTTWSTYHRATGIEVDTCHREKDDPCLHNGAFVCLPRCVDYILLRNASPGSPLHLRCVAAKLDPLESTQDGIPFLSDHSAVTATMTIHTASVYDC